MSIQLRELEYFIAIAEQGHFGKASQAVRVSQPTLSMQLKKLEESLGCALIERQPRAVVPTARGAEVLPIAREIVRLVGEFERRCRQGEGRLRLGVLPTIAPYLLPKITRGISRTLKGRKVSFIEEHTAQLVKRVREGSIDIALLSTPLHEPGLTELPLYEEPFLLAVPRRHPLAKRGRVHPHDVAKERVLLLGEGHCMRDQAVSLCHLGSPDIDTDFSASSIDTLRSMVALGVGVTLVPTLAARRSAQLVYLPFTDPSIARTIGLLHRVTFNDGGAVESLATLIRSVAAAEGLSCISARPAPKRKGGQFE